MSGLGLGGGEDLSRPENQASCSSMILPRTRGKRTGAWAWQYSALLYCESLVVQPGLEQIRSWLKRRDGLVTPLMAAPLTMSVMFRALLVVARFSN